MTWRTLSFRTLCLSSVFSVACLVVTVEKGQAQKHAQDPFLQQSSFMDFIQNDEQQTIATLDVSQMQVQVENAIGMTTATVSVSLIQPDEGITPIPWRENAQPHIRVAIPNSWDMQRASQTGNQKTTSRAIQNIIQQTIPGATFEIESIEVPTVAKTIEPSPQEFAKELVLVFGLFVLLLLGCTINRRSSQFEHVDSMYSMSVEEEANAILSMEFSMAKQTIDAMDGTRKYAILQAIVSNACEEEVAPIVEVHRQHLKVPSHST